MSYYFMASILIEDDREYAKYLDKAGEVFSKFQGKYLAVDNAAEVLEGDWNYGRAVLIEFPTREDLLAWYRSEEYQQILKHRLNAATCDTILIQGKQ